MPKVSVLVPIYNVERYLPRCLDSLTAQTLEEMEIIAVDDGSTDSSGEILDRYAAKDSRFRVIHKQNTGYGHTMNTAMDHATGAYIGILESDDFAEPDMFAALYKTATQNAADIVKSNYWEFTEEGANVLINSMGKFADNVPFIPYDRWQIFFCPAAIWSALYRREFLAKNRLRFSETPGASYQDTAFHFKALSCAERMTAVDKAFVHYRTDSVNSSLNNKEKVYCVCGEFENLWQYLEARPHLMEKVREIIPYAQYLTYRWNYQRIADSFKMDFLQKASADFLRLKQRGCLEKTYWDSDAWEKLKTLLLSPLQIYLDSLLKKQSENICKAGVLSQVMKYPKRYIYGAGVVGKKTARFLLNNNVSITGFTVSSADNANNTALGLSVTEITTLNAKNDETIFIVAVKEGDFEDIFARLNSLRYTNIVFMSKELRRALQI